MDNTRGHHLGLLMKKVNQKFLCYAVAEGRKLGVFYEWEDCEAQILDYRNPTFKGFNSHIAAVDWLREQRSRKAVHTMLSAINSADEKTCAQQHAHCMQSGNEMHDQTPVAKAVPIPVPTAVPVLPIKRKRDFSPVSQMAELIASLPPDHETNPPPCKCPTCPYASGDITHIRTMLLQRWYQTCLDGTQQVYKF